MPRTLSDVACTLCGCVCDDLRLTVDGDRITAAEGACRLAEPWLLAQTAGPPRDGDLEAKLDRAAAILRDSRSPLIAGLGRCTTDGLRAAAELADRIGATIDPVGGAAHLTAFQRVGESTCTLGEVRHRADLVLFWGCDPMRTHPRLLERFTGPAGRFIAEGRAGRRLIAVGADATETDSAVDEVVRIPAGRDWEALHALRLFVAGKEPRGGADSALRDLAARMAAGRFGVVFWGDGLTHQPHADRAIEELLRLVAELNGRTRFYSRRLKSADVAGAGSLLAWQTGYATTVNFASGFPRSQPGEWSAPDLLACGEVDCAVLVGTEMVAGWPAAAREHLGRIPVIRLDPPGASDEPTSAVRFTTAVYGVHRPGTAHRLDDVGIPLRVVLPSDLPDEGDVLRGIAARL